MLIQRIIPKAMLPMAVAAMTCFCVSQTKAATLPDSFERREDKTEVVIKESQNNNRVEKDSDSGFPWMHVISLGCLAAFGGLCALGNYVEKKFDQKEAEQEKPVEAAENNN